ncbi:ribonuclease H-like domain-containing protein [Tanacetum coccineum]
MDQDSVHMVAASKVPMLKPGEYKLWRMRIEQYIQMVDYSLWEVIENGNVPIVIKLVEGVETTIAPATAKEKAQIRLELKAISTLLMGIPNEHQLKFNFIKDAKSLLQVVEKRFGGNAATKKTQRNLLKQQYENFTASSSEVLDQTFDRLQKLINQLEIHGESILQEDMNQKFLRSMSPEWNTHTIVWRNKPEIDTLSLDDLYNNLKIYEPELALKLLIRDRLEVADGYANNKGKENIERKLTINGNETIGFDKSKVECYNCHKRGHFVRECRALRNQENRNRENTRRVVPMETTTSNALVSSDGSSYDWSDQAEEGLTNFLLMACSSTSSNSEVSTDSNCSSSCLENVKILKEQNEQLLKDLRTTKLNAIAYKTGLESVEARLLVYKKNESIYEEDINVLKREIHLREIVDKCKTGLGYNAVPPPYTGKFMPPKPDLSFSGLEEFTSEPIVIKPIAENSEAKASEAKPKTAKIEKKTVKPSFAKIEFVKPKEKNARKTAKQVEQLRHMTGNISYLTDYEEIDGGYVSFGGNPKRGKITRKVPRKKNMYSVDLKNIVPKGGLTCLFAKATSDEYELWHRRLGHINFKTMNKLVKGNLVRGLPSKLFENNQTCVACQKGKQHRASSERKNRLLIEAARKMLVDSKLPTTFLAEAVNTACYVQNMVLVSKPHNKTPYELFLGRKPALCIMRPVGCPVTILNNIDHLGKFDGKADEGFFVGYSINSKAFRVFNSRTRIVEENMHVQFSENIPNIVGSGPNWFFDIDALIKSMNYKPVVARKQSNGNTGTNACDDAGDDEKKVTEKLGKEGDDSSKDSVCSDQEKEDNVNNTNNVNAASTNEVNAVGGKSSIELLDYPNMLALEDYSIFDLSSDDQDVGAEADMNNLDTFMPVSPIPTTRVHKDHPVEQIIKDLNSTPQTRRMTWFV